MTEDPKALELFTEVFEKTKNGRIKWEPTADETLFITPIGGQFTLSISSRTTTDSWGNEYELLALVLKDKDRELLRVTTDIQGLNALEMRELYDRAFRQANHVDEKIDKIFGQIHNL